MLLELLYKYGAKAALRKGFSLVATSFAWQHKEKVLENVIFKVVFFTSAICLVFLVEVFFVCVRVFLYIFIKGSTVFRSSVELYIRGPRSCLMVKSYSMIK